MNISKKFIAGLMTAVVVFSSMPAISAEAASLKYRNQYIKSIEIEKPTVPSSDNSSSDSSSGTGDSSSGTGDTSGTGDYSSNGSTDASGSGSSAVQPAEPEIQNETVKVMKGMQFLISATRYGKLINTNKNSTNFKFKTSNRKVAKVTGKGLVTTLKCGKCDITVINKKDGVKYILHLIVQNTVKVKSVTLNTPSKSYKSLDKKFSLSAKIKVSTKKAGTIPVTWFSTDTGVARVDNFGNVIIKGYGVCYICCMAGSNNVTGKCKVTVKDPNAKKPTPQPNPNPGSRPAYNTGKVVDLSKFNTVVDWGQLRENVDAVIIRCGGRYYGSGVIFQDEKFAENVFKCQQYGIPYSVYFYSNATSAAEGAEEAEFMANRVAGHSLCFPAFMDIEWSTTSRTGRADNLSVDQRTEAAKAACQQLNSRGLEPGIYGSTNFLKTQLNMDELPYSTWVAQYAPSCTYDRSKLLWQFTSSGSGYGVRTGGVDRCDVSYWYN